MHDAAEESYDDNNAALGKSGRPPRRSSRRRLLTITKSHPYVKCNPLALNATNNARKSSWSILAGRFPSKRS